MNQWIQLKPTLPAYNIFQFHWYQYYVLEKILQQQTPLSHTYLLPSHISKPILPMVALKVTT